MTETASVVRAADARWYAITRSAAEVPRHRDAVLLVSHPDGTLTAEAVGSGAIARAGAVELDVLLAAFNAAVGSCRAMLGFEVLGPAEHGHGRHAAGAMH